METAELVGALMYLGAGVAMGFGAIGAGVGEGYAAHQACGGTARQPAVASSIQRTMLIGQAMAESASIFALIVAIMLIFMVDASGATVNQGVAFVGAGIAIGFGAFGRDLRGGILGSSKRPVEPINQWIEIFRGEIIDPAEVGDHLMADFPLFSAIAFDELQIAPATRFRDLCIHAATVLQERHIYQC